jgi:uncharacterized spore protein YtfJ
VDEDPALRSGQAASAAGGRAADVMARLLEAADVSKVYSEPIAHGDTLLIPAAEVLAVAGFGIGAGSGFGPDPDSGGRQRSGGGGGGGGGGRTLARSVAVIVSTPEGVRVEPIVDLTKIALAGLTALGFVWAAWRGMSRGTARGPRLFGRG